MTPQRPSANGPSTCWTTVSTSGAYNGMKVFIYKADTKPGDLNCQRGTDRY